MGKGKRPPWVVKQPSNMTPDEWATVLTHPEGIAEGCSQLSPSPIPQVVYNHLSKPQNRYRIFGNAEMTYTQWRLEGDVICPGHANRIDLAEPIGPTERGTTLCGNVDIQLAVNACPWKPACVIAAENNLDPKKVAKYKKNHPIPEADRLRFLPQQEAWEHRVLVAGLDKWLENGYPARVFTNIERRNRQ